MSSTAASFCATGSMMTQPLQEIWMRLRARTRKPGPRKGRKYLSINDEVIKPEGLASSLSSSLHHLLIRNTLIALSVPQSDLPDKETVMARKYSKKASKKVEKAM